MDGTELVEVHPLLRKMLEDNGLYSEALMRRISKEGSLSNIEEIPEAIRRVFVCSHDVSPEYHVRMQAAFQRHTDNAVSKTVNFPHSATAEDVHKVFMLAHTQGCKGVTIYRDGSREGQVLNIGTADAPKADEQAPDQNQPMPTIYPRPRPEVTFGLTERMRIGCGNLYVTVNYDENGICEVFTSTGKAGAVPARARHGPADLGGAAQRRGARRNPHPASGIRCPSTIRQNGMKCTSCPDAIARVIQRTAEKMEREGITLPKPVQRAALAAAPAAPPATRGPRFCPDCGEMLEHEGGCVSCRGCGYSKCN